MFRLQQTWRAFQRQHEGSGDAQRRGPCRQRTLAPGVGRFMASDAQRIAQTSVLSARCTGQCVPSQPAAGRGLASAIRARAHRREVLPNAAASFRSDSGLPF
jgi:hypothetical protein